MLSFFLSLGMDGRGAGRFFGKAVLIEEIASRIVPNVEPFEINHLGLSLTEVYCL